MKLFEDRKAAVSALNELLPLPQMQRESWILIALSEGGIALCQELNVRMKLKVDWLLGESITAPQNPQCELGRVSETEEIVINDDLVKAFGIQYDYVYGEAHRKHEEKILSRIYHYRKGRPLTTLRGKKVLLVDQGAESGLKLMCAIKTVLSRSPDALYACAPVMPKEVYAAVEPLCDALFCPHVLEDYIETSCYYSELEDVSDEMIIKILGD
ncbi:phosphoribosyltransferase [Sulfurimonas sp. HSL-3221]|uniref:Phosphoribosyltransferase n=1 Tax=Sulfurimonas diazotrophicus TaxID=3131939 RepID=A0ABZ3HAK9_9BACT|nr:phosphoribosyltransferase [Sulfurimonas sp. HSL-3221]UFS62110.1 phosphoribosyltransferase [Sulfurimonas sp. HSL-3221]